MAQWLGHDHFFERGYLWATVSHAPAAQQVAHPHGVVGLHRVGNFVSLQFARPTIGRRVLRCGGVVSLFGVLVLWFKPILLGVAVCVSRHHVVQRAVQCALCLSSIRQRFKPLLLQSRPSLQ